MLFPAPRHCALDAVARAREQKCSSEGLGQIAMTPAVRICLGVLRAYLIAMALMLGYPEHSAACRWVTKAIGTSPHFRVNLRSPVTPVGDVSRRPGDRYAGTTMLIIAGGRAKLFTVFLVSIGLIAFVVLAIAIGVDAFLAGVGHYAPWEQIWTG